MISEEKTDFDKGYLARYFHPFSFLFWIVVKMIHAIEMCGCGAHTLSDDSGHSSRVALLATVLVQFLLVVKLAQGHPC